jgi:hypothetical protein
VITPRPPHRVARRGEGDARSRRSVAGIATWRRARRGTALRRRAYTGSLAPGSELVLSDGGFNGLDRVEVAVLAHESGAERGDELARVPAGVEEGGDELSGFCDLLLAVEQARKLSQQRVRVGVGVGGRQSRRRHIQEAVEMDAHRSVEHAAEELR